MSIRSTPPIVGAPSLALTSDATRRLLRRAGWTLVGLQLIGLLWWSSRVERDVGLSWDFMTYYQPFWAIAHGHLNPATTTTPGLHQSFAFWQQDGEFLIWLLAPLYWLFPNHQLGFWWLQDLALAGISAVCFRWIGELIPWDNERPWRENRRVAISWAVVLVLLLLNPWIYWSATFAVQLEPFGALFALLTLRALTQERRTAWVWALLTALCGSAEIIYLISAGLAATAWTLVRRRAARRAGGATAVAASRQLRRPLAVLLAGVLWILALSAVHGTRSVSSAWTVVHHDLRYLVGRSSDSHTPLVHAAEQALLHPLTVVSVIASHWLNLWANVAPGGLLGLLSVPGFFMSLPTLLENSLLKGQDFSYPGFSNLIVYPAMAVGTTLVVERALRRNFRLGTALAALVIANVGAWCAVWLPRTGTQFLTVSDAAASAIRETARRIPASAEVIASQGFGGAFADRLDVHVFGGPQDDLQGPELVPVNARSVWFVLSPNQGIEAPSTAATDQAIASVAALPGARLVRAVDGVWVFRWHPGAGRRTVTLGGPGIPLPGWVVAGAAGVPRLTGNVRSWGLRAAGTEGYVVAGDIWRLHAGRYVARVALSAAPHTNVEVWDDRGSGDLLLARAEPRSAGPETLRIPFDVGAAERAPSSTGPPPFAYTPVPAPHASSVEIRIWTPGHSRVSVSSIAVAGKTHA